MTYHEFIQECREDRARMQRTVELIDSGVLGQGYQPLGQHVIDTTAAYRAHLAGAIRDLEVLIEQHERQPHA